MSAAIKLPLRWHGGKWMLSEWIISHFPKHRVYVEPFGGGASVLMRKPRAYAEVYGDLNGDVVNFFEVLRDRPEDFERVIRLTPFSRYDFEQSVEPTDCPIERARRLCVRSFLGHSSTSPGAKTGFRRDSNRSGSTPARDWQRYPDRVRAISDRLQGVVIENRDALEVMRHFDGHDTLHFVDPPYLRETRSKASEYENEFDSPDEHTRLIEALRLLSGMVVLCGYPSALYETLLNDWARVETPAYADGARKRTEVLWLNPAFAEISPANDLFGLGMRGRADGRD